MVNTLTSCVFENIMNLFAKWVGGLESCVKTIHAHPDVLYSARTETDRTQSPRHAVWTASARRNKLTYLLLRVLEKPEE